jgi:acyl dehydratase
MIVPLVFEDYEIGSQRTSFGRTITETDFVVHAGHTGDFFPHHMDAEWCRTQDIGQRIAHGTMVFAIGIGLTATVINPHAMSYGYDRLRFIRPVHIGDTITTVTRIADKRDHPKRTAQGVVTERVEIRNQRGETVLACEHLYLVDRREVG